jgi:GTP-binding protein
VGRPNVGKSTLFNRLIGERKAIVEDTPGITRDRVYGVCDWGGREFTVVDTGGLGMRADDAYGAAVEDQAELAMEEADLILFLVDARDGLTAADLDVAEAFRRAGRPVLLVGNKADNERRELETHEFAQLGLGEVYPASAQGGRGVADLLDEIVQQLPSAEEQAEDEDRVRVAIVGRPNVGKSSLLNAILGTPRAIVSPEAGTTRDALDVPFEFGEHRFTLVDTAGIRRPGKVQGSIEYYMVLRAERAIERAEVAILVIDAASGVMDGDKRVGGLSRDAGKGCVIFVNKWDLVKGRTPREFAKSIRSELPFLEYAPVVFGSALEKRGVAELLDTCAEVANNHAHRVPTGELNRVVHEAVERRPYTRRGRDFKVYYATMAAVKPPTIVLFVNDPKLVHISYLRYLENQLRAAFGFQGTPVRLFTRARTAAQADAAVGAGRGDR